MLTVEKKEEAKNWFCDYKQHHTDSWWQISNKMTRFPLPEEIIYNNQQRHSPSTDCLNTVFGYCFH